MRDKRRDRDVGRNVARMIAQLDRVLHPASRLRQRALSGAIPVPRITELLAFEIPAGAAQDKKPCLIVPCPFCRGLHRFDLKSRYIRLRCSDENADLYYLVWAGEAPPALLEVFASGKSRIADPELLAVTQPRLLWDDVHVIAEDVVSRLDVSEN